MNCNSSFIHNTNSIYLFLLVHKNVLSTPVLLENEKHMQCRFAHWLATHAVTMGQEVAHLCIVEAGPTHQPTTIGNAHHTPSGAPLSQQFHPCRPNGVALLQQTSLHSEKLFQPFFIKSIHLCSALLCEVAISY